MISNEVLFSIIKRVSEVKIPGKKALQKLIYLAQRKGLELNYPYAIHHYGPYSSLLDYSVQSLEMKGYIELRQKGLTSLIIPSEISELLTIEQDNENVDPIDNEIIEYVISNFANRTTKDLELLTTTDFITNELLLEGEMVTEELVVEKVEEIKGDKFTNWEIINAIGELNEHDYLPILKAC
jgi:uncharacterized protein